MGLEEIKKGIIYMLKVESDTLLIERGKRLPKGMYTFENKENSVMYGTMYVFSNIKKNRAKGNRKYSIEGDKLQSLIERGVFVRC